MTEHGGQGEQMSSTTHGADGVTAAFTERFVEVDGARIRYLEAGRGSPVVALYGNEGLAPSPLHTLLAQHFRVIAVEIPGLGREPVEERPASPREVARVLAGAAVAAGVERYVLVGTAAGASLALWQAIDIPERIDALVLISPVALLPDGRTATDGFPPDPELARRLGDIQAATLVLFGTNDEEILPETGQIYAERITNCYYVLVYDAGRVIEAERPDALFAAVCDFVERRGTFIVERNSTAINP